MNHDGAEQVGRDSNPVDLLPLLVHFLGGQLHQRLHSADGHPVGLVRRVPERQRALKELFSLNEIIFYIFTASVTANPPSRKG